MVEVVSDLVGTLSGLVEVALRLAEDWRCLVEVPPGLVEIHATVELAAGLVEGQPVLIKIPPAQYAQIHA